MLTSCSLVKLPTCIRESSALNPGRGTRFFVVSLSPSIQISWQHLKLGKNHFSIHANPFSSFYCASVANAPNVLQPYWLTVLPLDVPALTASLLLWGPSGHGREMADEFCLKMPDFHVTFWDLLHAVNLWHGTDGFTSPPKEGVLRIFRPEKSNGFGRVWTPELGYQKPARYL